MRLLAIQSYGDATHLLAIMHGIGVPARVLCGYLTDRYVGLWNSMTLLHLCNVIIPFSWMAVHSSGGIYAFICIYGLVQAAWQSIFAAAAMSFSRQAGDSGACIGIAFTAVGSAMLVGSPIGGALISSHIKDFLDAQAWAAASTTLGFSWWE